MIRARLIHVGVAEVASGQEWRAVREEIVRRHGIEGHTLPVVPRLLDSFDPEDALPAAPDIGVMPLAATESTPGIVCRRATNLYRAQRGRLGPSAREVSTDISTRGRIEPEIRRADDAGRPCRASTRSTAPWRSRPARPRGRCRRPVEPSLAPPPVAAPTPART